MFHEERDTQSGYLEEAADAREERMTTTGITLAPMTLSAAGRSARRYEPIADDEEELEVEQTRAPRGYRARQVRIPNTAVRTRTPRPVRSYADDAAEEDYPYMTAARRQAAELAKPTGDDEQIAPSVRSQSRTGKRQKRKMHPLFWLGLTVSILLLIWEGLTAVPAWYVTTFNDPGTYGPTHGQILTMPLGNGDSAINPSTLLAVNINGQIELLKLFPGDAKKNMTFTGPNLAVMNFPDADKAEVALSSPAAGKVLVTIWSDEWDKPLHRYGISMLLAEDGKGGLTQDGPITIIQ